MEYGHQGGAAPGASSHAAVGEANYDTEQEKKFRIARLIALAFVYLFPVFFMGPDLGFYFSPPDPFFLIPDSLYELVLWSAVGVQIYFLLNPVHGRPRTFVYAHRNWFIEGVLYFFAVVFALGANPTAFPGLYSLPPMVAQLVFLLIAIVPILMITVRGSVIVDGQGRRVISLGLIPKVRSFDDVEGLGKLEVRVVNRGYSHHHLVIFFDDGKHWRLQQLNPANIPTEAARVTAATGLPNNPPAGG